MHNYIGTIIGLTIGNFIFQAITDNYDFLFAFKISGFQFFALVALAISNYINK